MILGHRHKGHVFISMPVPASQCHIYLQLVNTCESTSTFNNEKALVGAFSVIVKYQLY